MLLPIGASDDGAHSQNEKLDRSNYLAGIKTLGSNPNPNPNHSPLNLHPNPLTFNLHLNPNPNPKPNQASRPSAAIWTSLQTCLSA